MNSMSAISAGSVSFGRQIHDDFLLFYPDFFSGLRTVFRSLSLTEFREFQHDIRQLLSGGASNEDLVCYWSSINAGVVVLTRDARVFLQQVLEAADRHEAESAPEKTSPKATP